MFWLAGYVWLFTVCWLAGQSIRWLIKGGAARTVRNVKFVYWEIPLRLITGRPLQGTVRAKIAELERDLRVGDAFFGPVDRKSIMAIQREAGLVVDGVLGPITQSKINEGDRS
jgi:peptidoglycan hydrolase-like protein with peptidoglycan-binding domain